MKVRFQKKLTTYFFLLFLIFFLIQTFTFHLLKQSFILSSILGLILIAPLAYLLFKWITQPLKNLTQSLHQMGSRNLQQNFWGDLEDLDKLPKVIEAWSAHLQKKVDDVSRERDYLHNLLNEITEGILIVDGQGRIRMVNQALREFLSLPSEVEYRTLLEIFRNLELERAIQKVIQNGMSETLEITLPQPQKRVFEVNVVRITSLPEGKGPEEKKESFSVLAVFHEITRLKELEKIRQDFVANVSHELRTPLTTIKGYTETLLEGALKEEVAHQFVQVIKKHSDRLEKIVEDLLMLSKIESQEFQWNKEILSISDLIEEALELLKDSFEKKRMTVSLSPIPSGLQIYGDRKYLEQALYNLIDNAIKYGREKGMIAISVIPKNQMEVEISIKDDGIGIPSEDLPRIFERFYRVDKGRSRELGGTGLGLSIVKHIIQAHGGRVWAESTLGKGSTFYFTLPLHS